jgi:transcriptional regulator with XRE-family HTH domain
MPIGGVPARGLATILPDMVREGGCAMGDHEGGDEGSRRPPRPGRGAADAPDTLGARIRAARRRLGMSQDELSAAAAIRQPNLSRLERGVGGPPSPEALDRLAAALRVDPAWLRGTTAAPTGAPAPRDEFGAMTRLAALAAYRELLERRLRGEALPGDPRRQRALRVVLERTGGVPAEFGRRR